LRNFSGFAVKEGLEVKRLIQVCWDIEDEKVKEREINALLKAMDEFKLKESLIITEDFEKEEEFNGKKIVYKPLWKWLLE